MARGICSSFTTQAESRKRARQAKMRSDEALIQSARLKSLMANTQGTFVKEALHYWQRAAKKWHQAETFWEKAVKEWNRPLWLKTENIEKRKYFNEQTAESEELFAQSCETVAQRYENIAKKNRTQIEANCGRNESETYLKEKYDFKNDETEVRFRTPGFLKDLTHEMAGCVDLDFQWGSCPMTMVKNHKRYIGTVCHGKARILQAPDSDVCLNIPEGSKGVYVMGVHTDVSKFKNVIEDEECFVSPVVEILHKNEDHAAEHRSHTIRIPHCLSDTSQLGLIQVRRGRSSNNAPFHYISSTDRFCTIQDGYFVDHNYITVFSQKFSEFICTSCNNTCKGTTKLFLLGKLNAWRMKNVTTVQMKSFLCSPLYKIVDFRQHLFNVHKTYKLAPVGEGNVTVASQNFNHQQSHVTLKMYAAKTETNNWNPVYKDHAWKKDRGYFLWKKPMPEVMELDGCHQCRTLDPKEAMVVDIVSDGICSDFHGIFDLAVHPERTGDSSEKKRERNFKTQIFFTIESGEPLPTDNTWTRKQSSIQMDIVNQKKIEKQLLKIAENLTEKSVIHQLGAKLNLEYGKIETIFTDNPNSITTVAQKMLHMWYKRQNNLKNMSQKLRKALIDSNLNMIARQVLGNKSTPKGSKNKNRKLLPKEIKDNTKKIQNTSAKECKDSVASASHGAQDVGSEIQPAKRKRGKKKIHKCGDKAATKSSKTKNTLQKRADAETEVEAEKNKESAKKSYETKAKSKVKSNHSTLRAGCGNKVKSLKQNTCIILKTAVEAEDEVETKLKIRRKKSHKKGAESEVGESKKECGTKKTHKSGVQGRSLKIKDHFIKTNEMDTEAKDEMKLEATNRKSRKRKPYEAGIHVEAKSRKT